MSTFSVRRDPLTLFGLYVVDRYRHPNGTVMSVTRDWPWQRYPGGAEWAAENGYAADRMPRLIAQRRQGFTFR